MHLPPFISLTAIKDFQMFNCEFLKELVFAHQRKWLLLKGKIWFIILLKLRSVTFNWNSIIQQQFLKLGTSNRPTYKMYSKSGIMSRMKFEFGKCYKTWHNTKYHKMSAVVQFLEIVLYSSTWANFKADIALNISLNFNFSCEGPTLEALLLLRHWGIW